MPENEVLPEEGLDEELPELPEEPFSPEEEPGLDNLLTFEDVFKEKLKKVKRIPSENIVPIKLDIERNLLKVIVEDGLLYNKIYALYLEGVKNISGDVIEGLTEIEFYTELKPFHSSVVKVRSKLTGIEKSFSDYEVEIAIRNASQMVYRYLLMEHDPNKGIYKELLEKNENYSSILKYVTLRAAMYLLESLLSRLIAGDLPTAFVTEESDGTEGDSFSSDGFEFKLGDFQVKPRSEGDSAGDPKKRKEALSLLIDETRRLIDLTKKEAKFWLDESMKRRTRGYASVAKSGIKTNAQVPESRDF